MELNWKEIDAERIILKRSEQVRVTGFLPAPDGREAASVLNCSASVTIDGASSGDKAIELGGRISVTVTAMDNEGRPFAFESGAGFTHRIEAEEAAPGM